MFVNDIFNKMRCTLQYLTLLDYTAEVIPNENFEMGIYSWRK